jgi:O-antigen ligase
MVAQIGIILTMMSVISASNELVRILSLVMGGIVMILTASRGNMIILSLFVLFSYFYQLKRPQKFFFLFLSLLIFLLISRNEYLLNLLGQYRISRIRHIGLGISQRFDVFKIAIEDFFKSPIIGMGYRSNWGRGSVYFNYGGYVEAMESHSQWLGFLSNHGAVGFIILCGFSYAIGRRLWKTHKKLSLSEVNPELKEIKKYLLAIYIQYFISMIGWESLYYPIYSSFFFVFFGMIYRLSEKKYPMKKVSYSRL